MFRRVVHLGLAVALAATTACRAAQPSGMGEAAGFDAWVAGFRVEARAAGISAATLASAFDGVEFNPRILELDAYQPEFTRPVWEYLATAVSPSRIARGREMMARHGELLAQVSRHHGVDAAYIVAIWGMETDYGRRFGEFDVIEALATLAYQGRRQRFGQEQLMAALRILERGDIEPRAMVGSWAGAMGHTQFIPTTYLDYAVDWDADGARDLWGSLGDAFASTAHYLRRAGWRTGASWGMEVRLPADFDWSLSGPETQLDVARWSALGVTRTDGAPLPPLDGAGAIVAPSGHQGPRFLILDNFRAILRYNNSTSYALAVGHLADRLRGGGPIIASWPTWQRPLSRADRLELQRLLARLGYDPGGVDGIVGPRTRAAVKSFQQDRGLPPDGHPDSEILERLRRANS